MPDTPGILVFMPGHIEVYIGKGKVIEARGYAYGVVETNLVGRGWTKWDKCKFIKYIDGVIDMFEEGQELEALDYLVEHGRVTIKFFKVGARGLPKIDLENVCNLFINMIKFDKNFKYTCLLYDNLVIFI